MGIIGVVAALTIPNLNSSTADKEKVAKLQKLYSNLQDAFGRAEAVYGPFDEWFSGDANATAQVTRAGERMTEFMKVSKNCKTSSGCFANTTVQYLNGDDMTNIDKNSSYYKVILADGTSLAISKSFLFVDIDGLKGLSTKGKDFFEFYIRENGIYPENNSTDCTNDENGTCLSDSCFQEGSCAGWVIETGNMDYLKADDSGKCPNGKQLSWTNTSCK